MLAIKINNPEIESALKSMLIQKIVQFLDACILIDYSKDKISLDFTEDYNNTFKPLEFDGFRKRRI